MPTLKMGQFDGSTPLETFLAKYENCFDFYNCNGHERLCHLRASLDREAAQVLWEADKQSTAEDIVQLLRNRFGTQDQRERHRAQLKTVRRQHGASLQSVANEVRRLMALAFPGQRGPLWETIATDAFLDALDDRVIRSRIMERDPSTLDEAVKFACHLEAIPRPPTVEEFDDTGRRRDKLARGASADDDVRRLQNLESTLGVYRAELERCRMEYALLRQSTPVAPAPPMSVPPPTPQPWSMYAGNPPFAPPSYPVVAPLLSRDQNRRDFGPATASVSAPVAPVARVAPTRSKVAPPGTTTRTSSPSDTRPGATTSPSTPELSKSS